MTVTPQPSAGPGPRPATTTADAQPSMGELVAEASQHLSTLVRAEIELAKLELRSSVKKAGIGGAAFIVALTVFLFSLIFGFLALAEGFVALGLPRWGAFLIVFGIQLVLVALLVLLGVRLIKRVKAPTRSIATGKETVAYLRKRT